MYMKSTSSKVYFIKCNVNYILSIFYTNVILISYKNTLNKRFMKSVVNLQQTVTLLCLFYEQERKW